MAGTANPGALRAKYEAMLGLRARGKQDVSPRAELADLAARFPGALRELDTLTLDEIRARIDALADAERDPACVASWMTVQTVFHELARGALDAKRWLGGRRAVTGDMKEHLRRTGAAAAAWADDLDAIARPPSGRVLDLVYARVAVALGIPEREVRALVWVRPKPTTTSSSRTTKE